MLEFIAELSSNHLGDPDRALALVDAAADAGATAVKLQCWTPGTMVRNKDQMIEDGPWKGMALGELYAKCHTPWDWFPEIAMRCKRKGIDWFSSVMDLEALKFLESIGAPRYKISSFELTDLALIEACAKTRKPLVMSTGMAKWSDISAALQASAWTLDVTLLRCVSAYPAPSSDYNLATMVDMRKCWNVKVGLSDHTTDYTTAVAAVALGAVMVEKHLKLSGMDLDGGPDAAFSATPFDFKMLTMECKIAAAAVGQVRYGPAPSEIYTDLRRTGEGGRG